MQRSRRSRCSTAPLSTRACFPAEVVGPFAEHAILDAEEGHRDIFIEVYAELGPLPGVVQTRIAREVFAFVHMLASRRQSILDFYGPSEGPKYFSYAASYGY